MYLVVLRRRGRLHIAACPGSLTTHLVACTQAQPTRGQRDTRVANNARAPLRPLASQCSLNRNIETMLLSKTGRLPPKPLDATEHTVSSGSDNTREVMAGREGLLLHEEKVLAPQKKQANPPPSRPPSKNKTNTFGNTFIHEHTNAKM